MKRKKTAVVLLCLLLVAFSLGGCLSEGSGSPNDSGGSGNGQTSELPENEGVEPEEKTEESENEQDEAAESDEKDEKPDSGGTVIILPPQPF